MSNDQPVIHVRDLVYRYGKAAEAVHGLNLTVPRGKCYGLFGRNGAGKTTTMKCLLNLLRPKSGSVELFGLNPRKAEVEIKSRLTYVPDFVAFYPWMSVRDTLNYFAAFRKHWNLNLEKELLEKFRLDPQKNVNALSKGQKTQVALMTAVCPEPELLILDEPTSGLDPIVRREFIETVIGAYQEGDPGNRTVFVSTHLISEFEGLIDEFTIMDAGREVVHMNADEARQKYQRIRARFAEDIPPIELTGALSRRDRGRELEVIVNGASSEILERLRANSPEELTTESLQLEEIFAAELQ